MNYPNDAPAAAYANPIGHDARALKNGAPTPVRGPSLEERLLHLQRGVERLCKLRSGLEQIADRICLAPEVADNRCGVAPAPSDLTGRFGDTINDVHNQLDALERLAERVYFGLFSNSNLAQAERAR